MKPQNPSQILLIFYANNPDQETKTVFKLISHVKRQIGLKDKFHIFRLYDVIMRI